MVAEIGFPSVLLEAESLKVETIDGPFVKKRLEGLEPSADINKNDNGHLLLAGGFDGMEGAIMMTAMAAFENGTGLATLLTTEKAREIIAGRIPELITRALPSGDIRALTPELLAGRRYDVLVIGPGMGRTETARDFFTAVMDALPVSGIGRVLIDGDGLYHLAGWLREHSLDANIDYVITPHFMEASRLTGISVEEIGRDRLEAARKCAAMTGAVVLLKGPASIVTDGSRTFVNTSGNPALAAAGSGDVLSGVIGSFLLRKITAVEAASIGCHVHGRAADLLAQSGRETIKATDLIPYLRAAARF